MRSMLFAFSFFAAVAIPVVSFGQMNGGGRTNTGGSGSSGSSGFGTSGSSGFGSGSSFGSAGFGTFGSGSSSATGNGFGAMGSGGGMGMGGQQGGMGMGGNQQGGGFLGVNANQFLGSSAGGQNQQGRNGMNGMTGMNGMNGMNNRGGGNRGNMNTMNSMLGTNGMNSANNRQQQTVRPRQKIAFDYPAPKVEAIHTNMNTQLQRIAIKNPGLSNVMLSSEGNGQMVLRGAVKSEADAKLAANLVRLEPGVRSVRSELTFPPESAPAE